MEGTLKDLQAEIQSAAGEVAALEAQLKEHPDEITKERSIVLNPEVTAMRTKLVDLERQRDELLQRYTPQSRFVKDKEAEIATSRPASREGGQGGRARPSPPTHKDGMNQQIVTRRRPWRR
jgi:uncharacterized protein involved in exopolysaccharide biosynthesis